MLSDDFRDCEISTGIRYRTYGMLLNPRRSQAVTKVRETILRDFLFADDCAINASHEMQVGMDSFSSACNNFGLTSSTKKPEVTFQPAPGNQYHKP